MLFMLVYLIAMAASGVSFAQVAGSAQLHIERRGHTATLLNDGRVLIVGGDNQYGIVSQAEIFDPVLQASSLSASSLTGRTDHTATMLPDGRVMIIGGQNESSALGSSEIFNPLTSSFDLGPSLTNVRSGHSATLLSDGKILIVGGDAAGSAEILDPATQSFSAVTGSLNIARKLHSAILLSNGQVLIVGGVNGQNAMLNSAEVYDPATQSFYFPVNSLQTPRALATLHLLPDGKVQVIGGDSDFSMEIFDPQNGIFNGLAYLPPTPELLAATLSTRSRAALMSPTASQNPNLQGALSSEILDLLDRADHSITELLALNQALVIGGVNSAGQVLNSGRLVNSSPAKITTDKTDYAPGEIVTITGMGFQPNEVIALSLTERPDEYPNPTFNTVADQQGNFIFLDFAPDIIDLGRTFTFTAIGQSSGFAAQTVFTDSRTINSVTLTANAITIPPGVLTVNAGATISASVNATTTETGANTRWRSTGWRISTTAPGTVTCVNHANHDANGTFTEVFNTTAPTTAGTYDAYFIAYRDDACSLGASNTFTLVGAVVVKRSTSTSVSLSPDTVTVGQGSTVTVTVADTATGTKSTPTGTIALSSSVGSDSFSGACTLAQGANPVGTASCQVTVTPATASIHTITATFSETSAHLGSTGNAALTVNKADQTITFGVLSNKTYGDPDFTVSATASSGLAVSFSSQTPSTCNTSGTNGSNVSILAHGSCTIRASQAGDANYNAAIDVDQSFTINKAAVTANAGSGSATYDGTTKTPSACIVTGTYVGDLSCVNNPASVGPDSGTTTIVPVVSGTGLSNFDITMVNGTFTINKRAVTVTADAKSKTYGDADPALTYQITSGSLAFSDSFTGALTRDPGESVGSYAILQGTLSITNIDNYDLTYGGANLTINKRPVTVTADAKVKIYGDADPALTYQITSGSLAFSDSFTGALTRAAGEAVGNYAIQQGTLSINNIGNYDLTYVGADLTINKRAVTVTADAKVKTYGDADPALTYQITSGSLAFSDAFTGALIRVAGETVLGSPYAIQQGTLTAGSNYNLTYVGANFTIIAKAASVTPDNNSKYYGEPDPVPLTTGTLTGFLAADGVTATYSRTSGEAVSPPTYTISAALSPLGVLSNYNVIYNTANFTIYKRPTTITYTGALTAYSGQCTVTVSATLKDTLTDLPMAGETVTITIGSQSVNLVTNSSGIASGTLTVTQNVGTVYAGASYAGNSIYANSSVGGNYFTVSPNPYVGGLPNQAVYTGSLFFWTTSSSSSTATLTLSAMIRDTDGVCIGNIRDAKVTFAVRNGSTLTPLPNAQNLPVGLVDPANTEVGTATAISQYNLGSANVAQLQVAVIVGGNYYMNNTSDDVVVTVAKPGVANSVVGGGALTNAPSGSLPAASGYLAAGPAAWAHYTTFSANVKYNKSKTNPQGGVTIIVKSYYRPDGTLDSSLHTYLIKSNSITEFTLPLPGRVSFGSKATIQDISNPNSPINVDGGATLQMTMTNGSPDAVGIVVYKKSGGVWFSSSWDTATGKTLEKPLLYGDYVMN
jgi:hypothetical protein